MRSSHSSERCFYCRPGCWDIVRIEAPRSGSVVADSLGRSGQRGGEVGEVGEKREILETKFGPAVCIEFSITQSGDVNFCVQPGFDVGLSVAHHRALRGIEAMRCDHLENETRRRLAIFGGLIGAFRGETNTGEEWLAEADQFFHSTVHGECCVHGEIAAADAGLIREEEEFVAEIASAAQALDDAWEQLYAGGIREVMFVDDERAIAVEKKRLHQCRSGLDVFEQLGGCDRGRTELANDDAGSCVGEMSRGFEIGFRGQGQHQSRESGVTGA